MRDRYRGWTWTLAWDNAPDIRTWSLRGTGAAQHLYLKVAAHRYPSVADEVARTRWARPFLPVPEVVESGSDTEVAWFV